LRQFGREEWNDGERIGENHKKEKNFSVCKYSLLNMNRSPSQMLNVWRIRVYLESKIFGGDNLWEESSMIEQQLGSPRKKDNFLDIKKKVSFPFGNWGDS
jgi:hypothetical protein